MPDEPSFREQPSREGAPEKSPPRPIKRRKWRRRILKAVLFLIVLFSLLILLLPSLVSSDFARRQMAALGSRFLERPVVIQRISLSWAGRFELEGCRLPAVPGEGDAPLFELERLRVRWAWKPLFSRKLRLDECLMEGFRLRIERSAAGEINLLKLLPPTEKEVPEKKKPPEKEAPPKPPLAELPVEAVHILLRDWKIDITDAATTLPFRIADAPLRAAFEIEEFRFDLSAPTAPAVLDLQSVLHLGDGGVSAPLVMQTEITPGLNGYLDWKQLSARLEGALLESRLALVAGPAEAGREGFQGALRWSVHPSSLSDFAASGLDLALPARASGVVSGSLRGSWDAASSASLFVQTRWDDLLVAGDALGTRTVPLGDLDFAASLFPGADGAALPAFSAWELGLDFASSFLRAHVQGSAHGLGAGLSPGVRNLRCSIAYDPQEIMPVLDALGIALPAEARMLQSLRYEGEGEGGLEEVSNFRGLLALEVAPLEAASGGTGGPTVPERIPLGMSHVFSFHPGADRAQVFLKLGEMRGAASLEPLWDGDPWLSLEADVCPVLSGWNFSSGKRDAAHPSVRDREEAEALSLFLKQLADRGERPEARVVNEGIVRVALRADRAAARAVELGFAPAGIVTTGSLDMTSAFVLWEALDAAFAATLRGAFGFTPDPALESAAVPEGVGPADIEIPGIFLGARFQQDTRHLDAHTSGSVVLSGSYETPPAVDTPFQSRLRLPASWDISTSTPLGGKADLSIEVEAAPHVVLAGAFALDKAEQVRFGADFSFLPDSLSLDLRRLGFALGEWLDMDARAVVENLGQERIDSHIEMRMQWGESVLSWIPPSFLEPLNGLMLDGATSLTVSAAGRWDPARPSDALRAQVAVHHVFKNLRAGSEEEPLAHVRNWDVRVGVDGAPTPEQPLPLSEIEIFSHLDRADALGMAGIEQLSARLGVLLDPAPPLPVRWDAGVRIGEIVAAAGPLPVRLGPIHADSKGRAESQTQNAHLEEARVSIAGLLDASAEASFTSATQEIVLRVRADLPDLSAVSGFPGRSLADWEANPAPGVHWTRTAQTEELERALADIPPLTGSAGMALDVHGRIPGESDLLSLRLPLKVALTAWISDFGTSLSLVEPVMVSGLQTALHLDVEESTISLRVLGGLDRALTSGTLPLEFLGPEWKAILHAGLEAGAARWTDWRLTVPNWGLTFRLDGGIEGGSALSEKMLAQYRAGGERDEMTPGAENEQDLLEKQEALVRDLLRMAPLLAARTDAEMRWESADWMSFPVADARARGGLSLYARLKQEPGREVASLFGMDLQNVSATAPGVRVQGADGSLRALLSGRRQAPVLRSAGYATDQVFAYEPGQGDGWGGVARFLAPPRREQLSMLRIEEIAAEPWVIRGLRIGSEGDVRDWALSLDCENLMGGRARGRLRLQEISASSAPGASDWSLEMEGAFTGVSAREALPAWQALDPAETELSGVFGFRWMLAGEAKTPADLLKRLELRFTVTQIGARALQGFLLALDPEEKNPSFVSARQALGYGRPDYVRFAFRQGLMDMDLRIRTAAGIAIPLTLLQRAPIGDAVGLEALRPQLEGVLLLQEALQTLSNLDQWATVETTGEEAR